MKPKTGAEYDSYNFPEDSSDVKLPFRVADVVQNLSYERVPVHPHRHNYYEIFLFEKGGGTHMIDFKDYAVHDKGVHLVRPGTVHLLKRDKKSKGTVILFSPEVFPIVTDEHIKALFAFFDDPLLQPVAVCETGFEKLMMLGQLLHDEKNGHLQGQTLNAYIQSLMSAFLLTVKTYFKEEHHNKQDRKVVSDFKRLVNEHFTEGMHPRQYADKLYISEKTLARAVKDALNTTPAEIIKERLLLEACRILISSDMPIKEIAYELQFADPAYFTRVFRAAKGMSPNEYREQMQQKYK